MPPVATARTSAPSRSNSARELSLLRHTDRFAWRRDLGFGLVFACTFALLIAPIAFGATFTVSNTHDSGAGSLRKAIQRANDETTNPGKDTIKITATGSIKLQSPLPDLDTVMVISGPGARSLTVTRAFGAPDFRIFFVDGVTVSISGLSVKKGKVQGTEAYGGGIYNAGSTLTLKSVTVANNSAITTDSSSGSAVGGGIYNSGSSALNVKTSRITGNEVSGSVYLSGSGIASQGSGGLDLVRSTVDGNVGGQAVGSYGGTIDNSTIAGNDAAGLFVSGSTASTTVRSSTIAANTGDPNSFVQVNMFVSGSGNNATFQNTIVADPPASGSNCYTFAGGVLISQGYNLDSDDTCNFDQTTDRPGKDPKLGSLANNGGPTPTMAIPMSSPATDKGDSDGLKTDQRGKRRPVDFPGIHNAAGGDGADIGAFEIQ